MRRVKLGLIRGFDGEVIKPGDGDLTVKDVFVTAVGSMAPTDGKQAVLGRKLGQKLYDCGDPEIELEDAEFELLKAAMEQNRPGYVTLVLGSIWGILESAAE